MSATVVVEASPPRVAPRGGLGALCAFEVRTAARSGRLWLGVVLMGLVAAVVTALGLTAFRQLGVGASSPAAVALLDLMLLVPSAVALVLGAAALQRDRESGFLDMLRCAGMSGTDIVTAKLAATLSRGSAVVMGGFGAAALVLSGSASAADLIVFAALLLTALLTTASCGAIGLLVASCIRSRGGQTAMAGLAVWSVLAVGLDLALFAVAPVVRMSAPALFVVLALDPIEAGRVLGLLALGADSTVLGPLGTLLRDELGTGRAVGLVVLVDALWIGLGTIAAGALATRRD